MVPFIELFSFFFRNDSYLNAGLKIVMARSFFTKIIIKTDVTMTHQGKIHCV